MFYIVPAGAEGETASAIKKRAAEAEKNALSKSTWYPFLFQQQDLTRHSVLRSSRRRRGRDCGVGIEMGMAGVGSER